MLQAFVLLSGFCCVTHFNGSTYFNVQQIMIAYISVSFSKRSEVEPALQVIRQTLQQHSILPFIFVDERYFLLDEEKKMMKQCMEDIDKCDLLIAEVSDKAIGVGIEVGYAKAKGKPVVYLRKATAEHSTTTSGISDYSIVYDDESNLQIELNNGLKTILENK